MTIEILENKIEHQISFMVFSGKTGEEVICDIKTLALEYAKQFKHKAEKWDKLEHEIAKKYIDENGDELTDEQLEHIDLSTIGEITATAFGWL